MSTEAVERPIAWHTESLSLMERGDHARAYEFQRRAVSGSPSHLRAILASPNPPSLRLEPTTTDTRERFLG